MEFLILYGSNVEEDYMGEDMDLCYLRKRKLDFEQMLSCNSELMDIFKNDKINLVHWSDASSLLKNEMVFKNKILFGNKDLVIQYLNAGQRMYWDDKKYYDGFFKMEQDETNRKSIQ